MRVINNNCSGCRICELICSNYHFSGSNPAKAAIVVHENPDNLSFCPKVCNQCGTCYEVCPVGAIENKSGVYVVNPEDCTLCELCVSECPLGVIYTHKDVPHVIKCDGCNKCIEFCPEKTLGD